MKDREVKGGCVYDQLSPGMRIIFWSFIAAWFIPPLVSFGIMLVTG